MLAEGECGVARTGDVEERATQCSDDFERVRSSDVLMLRVELSALLDSMVRRY